MAKKRPRESIDPPVDTRAREQRRLERTRGAGQVLGGGGGEGGFEVIIPDQEPRRQSTKGKERLQEGMITEEGWIEETPGPPIPSSPSTRRSQRKQEKRSSLGLPRRRSSRILPLSSVVKGDGGRQQRRLERLRGAGRVAGSSKTFSIHIPTGMDKEESPGVEGGTSMGRRRRRRSAKFKGQNNLGTRIRDEEAKEGKGEMDTWDDIVEGEEGDHGLNAMLMMEEEEEEEGGGGKEEGQWERDVTDLFDAPLPPAPHLEKATPSDTTLTRQDSPRKGSPQGIQQTLEGRSVHGGENDPAKGIHEEGMEEEEEEEEDELGKIFRVTCTKLRYDAPMKDTPPEDQEAQTVFNGEMGREGALKRMSKPATAPVNGVDIVASMRERERERDMARKEKRVLMDELFRVRADRIHYGQVLGKYRKEFEEREKERKSLEASHAFLQGLEGLREKLTGGEEGPSRTPDRTVDHEIMDTMSLVGRIKEMGGQGQYQDLKHAFRRLNRLMEASIHVMEEERKRAGREEEQEGQVDLHDKDVGAIVHSFSFTISKRGNKRPKTVLGFPE
ncbi:MAG: hypothetical protein DHS80DRAFT_23933 [Piptocephalis tieghemiana]|nr:MAG: hypothetical protein DHS80DRAFT_23933 [Piptocephalis tieghemiana]